MTGNWQEIIAGTVVLVALAYLARQLWRVLVRKRAGGCGASCGQCTAGPTESPPLVSLEAPQRQAPPT